MKIEIEGLSLEKLLTEAQKAEIPLHSVQRTGPRQLRAGISLWKRKAFFALCSRFGWTVREIHAGAAVNAARFLRRRWMAAAGAALSLALIALSSRMVLCVDVQGAGVYDAEVRRYLDEAGAAAGRLKRSL